MMQRPLLSLIRGVENSTIDLRLSQETTLEDIVAEHPDVVVLATGAVPVIPPIPGLDRVLTGEQILTERATVGPRVLIIGGGMIGLECAEFLAQRGHDVTIVELLEEVGRDMEPITRKLALKEMRDAGVRILTTTRLVRFEDQEAYIESKRGGVSLGEFDSFVAAVGTRSIADLSPPLSERGIEVKVVGDARRPAGILDAVRDGFDAAMEI
jgi:pyruvate/2-oxoglutarate dehydrogenase complex dihydrolipoamide dehydrogenase (E3) component